MATRGRKPKPTAMKELEGNPGKHPLNTSEPKPNKKAPACPKWLEPEAKKEWRKKLMGSDPRKTLEKKINISKEFINKTGSSKLSTLLE